MPLTLVITLKALRQCLLLLLLVSSLTYGSVQTLTLPDGLSSDEKQRLDQQKKEKEHVEISLKLAIDHLALAHTNLQSQLYEQAINEVKTYGALIEYTVAFVNSCGKKDSDKKKLFKIIDLQLRKDLSHLESLRYDLPGNYGDDARIVYDQVHKAREAVLAGMFGKEFFSTDDPSVPTPSPEKK